MATDENNPSWLDTAQDSKTDMPDEGAVVGDQEASVNNDNDNDNDDEDEDDEENPFVLKESQALLSSKDGYGSVASEEEPEKDEETLLEATMTTRRPPRRNVCLVLFFLHRFITVLALALLLVTQVAPFFFLATTQLGDPVQFALRIYVALFCLIGILVETEALGIIQKKKVLHHWIWRGFLYSFLGLVGCEEGIAVQTELLHPKNDASSSPSKMIDIQINWAAVLMETCSWVVVGTGVLYFCLGVVCCQALRDKQTKAYRERLDQYKREEELQTSSL